MPITLAKDARRARTRLRKLLKSTDAEGIEQGIALLQELAADPLMQGIITELNEGITLDPRGSLQGAPS